MVATLKEKITGRRTALSESLSLDEIKRNLELAEDIKISGRFRHSYEILGNTFNDVSSSDVLGLIKREFGYYSNRVNEGYHRVVVDASKNEEEHYFVLQSSNVEFQIGNKRKLSDRGYMSFSFSIPRDNFRSLHG